MSLNEISRQVVVPLVVAGVTWVAGVLYTSGASHDLLQENIKATRELTRSVTDLQIQIAVFGEKYVTRDQFEAYRLAQQEKRHVP